MAAVRFSAAGEVLYAYLSGEVDHDAAQSLRIQLDDALVSRTPQTLSMLSLLRNFVLFIRRKGL